VLSSPVGLTVANGTATVTITNDDVLPTLSIAATDAAAAEQKSDQGVFTITRSGNTSAAVTVRLTWAGTAAFPADYSVTVSGGTLSADRSTLTLAAGATKATITVKPVDDKSVEGTETVTLTLVADASYALGSSTSATISIADNDRALVAAAAAPEGSVATLTPDRLAPVVRLAKAIWMSAAPGTNFAGVSVEIADLEGDALGVTSDRTVFIDAEAAGWGWSASGMDLLTVVLHELGHVLGLDHDDGGLMAGTLAAGESYLPARISAPARGGLIRAKPAKRLRSVRPATA
jgi:hypothetical protein